MAAGLYTLRLLQLGFESTAGTLVAATKKLVGDSTYTPMIEREFEEYPRGVRAMVTGGGFAKQRGSTIEHDGNLTYEEILYPMLSGIVNDAAPTGAGPYTWDFTPVLTGQASLKTMTAEFVVDDASTKHYEREAGYFLTTEFEVDIQANDVAKLKWTAEGRAEQSSTVTGSLAPITGRTVVPSNLFALWIDAAGGTIGTTAKTATLRGANIKVVTGAKPDYTLDGRADLDHTGIQTQMMTGELELTLEHNANAATEIAAWRAGTGRLVRLKADNGAAAGANKAITFDMSVVYTDDPEFSQEDGIEIVTLKSAFEYDSTFTNAFICTVINGLSAQP
ncbi:MAG: hypothetical protein WAY02_09385 [Burkholderiaceae bacterium]